MAARAFSYQPLILVLLLCGSTLPAQDRAPAAQHYERASSLLEQGKLSQAEREIQQALVEVPLWPAALNLAGAIAQRQGRLEEAIQLFEGALALKPEQVAAASNLGYSYLALGKHDKAITQFDQVLRLRPRHSGAWFGRAQALAASGMLQESLKAGHEAESSSPDSPEVLLFLSEVYFRLEQPSQALEKAGQVGRLIWDNGEGLKLLGLSLLQHQQLQEALSYLERALELGTRDGQILQSLGYGYLSSSRLTKALPALEEAIQTNPDKPDGYYLLAIGYEMQGRYREAVEQLEEVLSRRPDHLEATHRYGVNLYKRGAAEQAWEPFGRVLERTPNRVEALYYRSLILFQRSHYKGAESLLQKLLALDQRHVAAHFKLAQIYARTGEVEKAAAAKQRYQKLRSEYSTHLRKVTFRIP